MNNQLTFEEAGKLAPTLVAWIDELQRELITLRAKCTELQVNQWTPVESGLEIECQCHFCVTKDPDEWHWKLYVNGDKIGIADVDDEDEYREVTLPEGYALCRKVQP